MRWFLLLVSAALLSLTFVPTARADHWEKSSDGYWYLWSDEDNCWYYYDNGNWLIDDEGVWVPSGWVSNGWNGAFTYDYNRDYRGYRRGADGAWVWHHNPGVGRGFGVAAGYGRVGYDRVGYGRVGGYNRGFARGGFGRGGGGRGGRR